MATKEQHLAQATRNEELAPKLSDIGEYGWAITALFYAALHLVQAYLVSEDLAVTTHAARRAILARTPVLAAIEGAYAGLKWASEQARYECQSFTAAQFKAIHERRYVRISTYIRNLVTA